MMTVKIIVHNRLLLYMRIEFDDLLKCHSEKLKHDTEMIY